MHEKLKWSAIVDCIFCGYNQDDVEKSCSFLRQFKALNLTIRVIGVATGYNVNFESVICKGVFDDCLYCDNEFTEFSAYQAGLDFCTRTSSPTRRGIIFINDTIWKKNLHSSVAEVYLAFASSRLEGDINLFGKRDSFGERCFSISNLSTNCWISTHLFFATDSFMSSIDYRIQIDLIGILDNRPDDKSESVDLIGLFFSGIDPYLAEKLQRWLFQGGWHNSAPLSSVNYVSFRRKLRSILNEIYLGAISSSINSLIDYRSFLNDDQYQLTMDRQKHALASMSLPEKVHDTLISCDHQNDALKAKGSSMVDTLAQLASRFGTDKVGAHSYTQHYEFHLAAYRDRPFTMLEIGVGGYRNPNEGGASLRMWSAYFQFANIWAIDLFDKSGINIDRVKIEQGSQDDANFIQMVNQKAGGFDIVIDDGSHHCQHIIQSFKVLFPLLKNCGLYIVEDTQTSYWPSHGGSSKQPDSRDTTMGYFKSLIHGLNRVEMNDPYDVDVELADQITSISFCHNMIFINKGNNTEASNVPSDHPMRREV